MLKRCSGGKASQDKNKEMLGRKAEEEGPRVVHRKRQASHSNLRTVELYPFENRGGVHNSKAESGSSCAREGKTQHRNRWLTTVLGQPIILGKKVNQVTKNRKAPVGKTNNRGTCSILKGGTQRDKGDMLMQVKGGNGAQGGREGVSVGQGAQKAQKPYGCTRD